MRIRSSAGRVTLLLVVAGVLAAMPAQAADHTDSPRTQADAAADINDVYAFRGTDPDLAGAATTVLVMTLGGTGAGAATRLSDKVTYNFNIADADNAANTWTIGCTATAPDGDNNQTITCSTGAGVSDSVAFNAVEAGNPGNETMRIFAGLRDDPFFFDLGAFQSVLNSVLAGSPDPTPLVDATGTDTFAPLNAMAIVVEIDNSVFGASTRLRVSASTIRTAPGN